MSIHPKKMSGFLALFFRGKNFAAPSDAGLRAFRSLRRQAKANGLQDMSLDEIDEVIAKARTRKAK